jgi:hypothetical protein
LVFEFCLSSTSLLFGMQSSHFHMPYWYREMRQVPMMELDANLCHLEKLAPDMPRVCLLIALPKLNIEVVAVPQ